MHRFFVAATLRSDMGNANRSVTAAKFSSNRIGAIMAHLKRYSFRGATRLAQDAGVAKSTISHLVRGQTNPLYSTVIPIVKNFEDQLGRPLDCREVVSEDGRYPTAHVCALMGCPGCLPELAYDQTGRRRVGFEDLQPGRWTGDVNEFADRLTREVSE